eukprot:PITA_15720
MQMREGNQRPKVANPCSACRTLRRRCGDKCVLAPYFPPNDPEKFASVHRIFGASNIIRNLQNVDSEHRDDAVSSMVYEARARLRDPVYGSAGVICQLQQQVSDLQAQLATAQAQILNVHCQHTNLVAFLTANNSSFGKAGVPADYHYDEPLGSSAMNSVASQVTDREKDINALLQEMSTWRRYGK